MNEKAPAGPIGRFVPCPANNDTHPECVALEIKRTWDKRGKERYHALCPLCSVRIFFNNWRPGPRSRTIVQAEAEGLYPMGIMPERKAELLRELGLEQVQPNRIMLQSKGQALPLPYVNAPKRQKNKKSTRAK